MFRRDRLNTPNAESDGLTTWDGASDHCPVFSANSPRTSAKPVVLLGRQPSVGFRTVGEGRAGAGLLVLKANEG